MFRWDNATVFQDRTAVLCRTNGDCKVYESGCVRNTGRIYHNVTSPLGGKLLSHSILEEKRYYQSRTKQDFDSFEYIVSGKFFFKSGNEMICAEAGDVVFLPQGEDNTLLYLPEYGTCEKYGFIPDGRLYGSLRELLGLRDFRCLSFGGNEKIHTLFDRLWQKTVSLGGSATEEELSGVIFEFLSIAAQNPALHAEPPLLKEIRRYLEDNLDRKIRLPQLAAKFGLSSVQLLALFRKHLNLTPNRYLIQRRMARAAVLLGNSELRINEIAFAVGYTDPLYFSGEFRRCHKVSPRQYRSALNKVSV